MPDGQSPDMTPEQVARIDAINGAARAKYEHEMRRAFAEDFRPYADLNRNERHAYEMAASELVAMLEGASIGAEGLMRAVAETTPDKGKAKPAKKG